MAAAKDLTGQHFGNLLVLKKADEPYISPSGKKTVRWVCRCELCGREVTMLRNTLICATSCGCTRVEALKDRPKNKKICVVCGEEFEAPPSSKRITCCKECSSIRKSMQHTGKANPWSAEAKARYGRSEAHQQQAKKAVVTATEAALALPEGQKGSQNRACKVWILKDPDGNLHRAVGMLPWARENYELFEPYSIDPEASANRVRSGFYAIASSLFYGAPSRKCKPTSTYKGWRLISIDEKSVNEQVESMMKYYKKKEDEDAD